MKRMAVNKRGRVMCAVDLHLALKLQPLAMLVSRLVPDFLFETIHIVLAKMLLPAVSSSKLLFKFELIQLFSTAGLPPCYFSDSQTLLINTVVLLPADKAMTVTSGSLRDSAIPLLTLNQLIQNYSIFSILDVLIKTCFKFLFFKSSL